LCRPKHVEFRINMKQNFATLLQNVGIFKWIMLCMMHGFTYSNSTSDI
jgi:hypothetical protein